MSGWLLDLTHRYAGVFFALTIFSIVSVVVMVTVGARVVARLPADYFITQTDHTGSSWLQGFPRPLRIVVKTLKNLLGAIFVLTGVVLLVLPGQGLLTLLAGLVLMEFPGKARCELWLVRRQQVTRSINWLRRRAGQAPLVLER